MKRILSLLTMVTLLFIHTVDTFAASSCTQQRYEVGDLKIIELSWTAHTDGTFTSVLTNWSVDGYLILGETDPGSPAPQDNYDITFTNTAGLDVFGGSLADRDTSTSERTQPLINGSYKGVPVYGKLTLNISNNNVNGAKGIVRIYYYAK